RFLGLKIIATAACEELASAFGEFDAISQLECVVVCDDDFGAIHVCKHVGRDQFPVLVVAVRVVRLEHTQTILDGQTGSDDEKATTELFAARVTDCIDGLPRNEHIPPT
ncbi:MAG TPA: hypothetical protein QF517_02385, partial [Pseudomonadales bacterium]|nr:hypothetical protein [Pseudomonadales bacterium]